MERVVAILEQIDRPGIPQVIEYIRKSNYATASCGEHHKYKGGLVDHSLEVSEIMKQLNRDIPDDSISICALLHDLGKTRLRGWNFEGRHAARAIAILERCGFQLTKDEEFAIRYHHRPSPDALFHNYRNALTKADMESTANWKKKHCKPSGEDALYEFIGKLL